MSSTVQVLRPSGILDGAKAGQLRQEVSSLVTAGKNIVLVDLKEVTFMDSSGLGALVVALKGARSAGGKLCLCSINEQVKMLFELTSMDRLFEIYADEAEFNQVVLATKN